MLLFIKLKMYHHYCVCLCVCESCLTLQDDRLYNNTDWSCELIMKHIRFNASFNDAWDVFPTGSAHVSSISLIKSRQPG